MRVVLQAIAAAGIRLRPDVAEPERSRRRAITLVPGRGGRVLVA
jgi:hypothetical protein